MKSTTKRIFALICCTTRSYGAIVRCTKMHNGCSAPSRTPTTSSRSTVVHLLSITHDGTSQTGKMTMSVIAAVAEFERDLLIERTQAGLARARSDGKAFGRPRTLNQLQTLAVQQRLASGTSIASLPKALGTSRQTAMRCSAQMTSYTRGWPRRQQHSMDYGLRPLRVCHCLKGIRACIPKFWPARRELL